MQDNVHLVQANVDVSCVAITFLTFILHRFYIGKFHGNPSVPEKHRPNIYIRETKAHYINSYNKNSYVPIRIFHGFLMFLTWITRVEIETSLAICEVIFCLIPACTNGWANNRDAADLRRHYDVTLMIWFMLIFSYVVLYGMWGHTDILSITLNIIIQRIGNDLTVMFNKYNPSGW